MPLIPRPKYRAKDWRLAMRTRERNEARRVACEQYTRANKLEEKNIELWATKMKLEQERDELYVSWQADHNSLELTHSINKKLHKRTLELKRERDSCKVSISIWTTSRDYWKSRAEKAEQERDTANHRLDECAESLRNVYGLLADAERENSELVAALKDSVNTCQFCGGTGIYYNSRVCRYCRDARFAIAKADEL